MAQLLVGKPLLLGLEQEVMVQAVEPGVAQLLFRGHQLGQVMEEPWVDAGKVVDPLDLHAPAQGLVELEDPLGVGGDQAALQLGVVDIGQGMLAVVAKPHPPHLQGAHPLLEGLLEGPADGHGLAHRLHRRGEQVLGLRELFKGPPGDLDHAVINGGLKGGIGLPGDVVGDLVQGIAHRQLGRDLGNGEAGGLGGQGRAA